ncbi:MAG: class I SAM-dependent methyltransferase [Thermoplasmata archaeon]|nr:class I SAM-dependent methyltransferase [Thermoplasmata archaeon]
MPLKPHEDAFGRGIYDYWKGEEPEEVIEREDGYIDVSMGPTAYLSDYKDWPKNQQAAMNHAKGRVLDIGCGGGRHALHLQEKGLDVLGIDNSPMAIKTCKERSLKKLRLMDITQISKKLGEFDTITMMGNNFGLFANRKRARWLLKRFYGMTSPDAYIIAETMDPYQTTKKIHREYHKFNHQRGRMGGQIRMRARYQKFKTPWFDYLFISKKELETLLKGTGWRAQKYLNGPNDMYIMILEKQT